MRTLRRRREVVRAIIDPEILDTVKCLHEDVDIANQAIAQLQQLLSWNGWRENKLRALIRHRARRWNEPKTR